MTNPTSDYTEDWLSLHSPQLLAAARPTAAISSQSVAVYCLTSVGGTGLADARAADAEVASLVDTGKPPQVGTTEFDELVEKLKASPLSGVATVTEMAFQRSAMNTAEPADSRNQGALTAYANSVNNAPFFTAASGAVPDGLVAAMDLLGRVVDLLQPPAATFLVSWIDVGVETIGFGISTFAAGSDGQRAQSKTASWTFRSEQWPVFAAQVAKKHVSTLSLWEQNVVTPHHGSPHE